jgi:antitoxin (DNA-binding transcriptional repressor) of toxin-antitoxin stability system
MTTVGSYQAKTHLPELIERVSRGEKILITRRGKPVALLTQPPHQPDRDVRQVVKACWRSEIGSARSWAI